MKLLSKKENKEYREIYVFNNGLIVKIPRYKKTCFFIGTKREAIEKGFNPKGTNRFYSIGKNQYVLEGYLGEKRRDNDRNLLLTGNININKNNIEGFCEEIKRILEDTQKD